MPTASDLLAIALQHHQAGRLHEAEQICRQIIDADPSFPDGWMILGALAQELGKNDEAVACTEQAVRLKPDWPEAHYNLGITYYKRGDQGQAVASFQRAIQLRPDYAMAHYNLGFALDENGEFDQAMACYDLALTTDPSYADAHWNRSLLRLLMGDFERGWAEYEWRWKTGRQPPRVFAQTQWHGEPLPGKTILIHAEQGLGDTIQFVRYAPLIKGLGARVVFECQPPLLKLLNMCAGIDQLVPRGAPLPDFNFHTPLLSVPHIIRTALSTIPASVPYIYSDRSLVAHWRKRLATPKGLRVGINWHGHEGVPELRKRDISVELFAKLAEIPGV